MWTKRNYWVIIPEQDIPFVKWYKTNIIINPHAIPSRMTIGQLIDFIGKLCLNIGSFGDCTFVNKGSKIDTIGEHLLKNNFCKGARSYIMVIAVNKLKVKCFVGQHVP